MTVLPIVTDLTALRVKSQPVTVFDDDLRRLAADMAETMRANNGIGLAAVQVGVPMRVIVVQTEKQGPLVMVNPKVTTRSFPVWTDMEGCLSLPGHFIPVRRPIKVMVHYRDLLGVREHVGLPREISRVVLHELDHLDGVLITDYALEGAR